MKGLMLGIVSFCLLLSKPALSGDIEWLVPAGVVQYSSAEWPLWPKFP